MKVICTSPSFAKYDDSPVRALQAHGLELVALPADAPLEALAPHLADAVAMIVAFTPVDDRLLALAPRLKIVCKHGVGVDNIDLASTRARSIHVTNVPDANKHAVADYTFALLLACARQTVEAVAQTRAGLWPRVFSTDVHGKTLGIVGLGNIGKQVALRAAGFSMRVLAFDFYPDQAFAREHGIAFTALDELARQSDFVTLHLPLTDRTGGLFGLERMRLMKPGAFLLNMSRGGIVDEADLYTALSEGLIAGAAADAFVQEPLAEHPLFSLPNFLPSAHVAGYTDGAVSEIGRRCVDHIVACVVRQEEPGNIVNR